jgi:L-threonylcarbamoyladenylate synthase
MKTVILNSEQGLIVDSQLELIKDSFLSGIPVVLPTETVYGIAAPYNNEVAIANIFKIKNRPNDNPLIVHISSFEQIKELSCEVLDEQVLKLLKETWPGPLTVLLKKSDNVPASVTANSDYVAIRMPKSSQFKQVIDYCGAPLVAPSANLSGKPSPTTAGDALEDLNGKIRYIVDGGQAEIGLESTVIKIDSLSNSVRILRHGKISKNYLINYFDNVFDANDVDSDAAIILSPGTKYKHYSPKAKVVMFDSKLELDDLNKNDYVLSYLDIEVDCDNYYLFESEDVMAKELFKLFRIADRANASRIFVLRPKINLALINRLEKATE